MIAWPEVHEACKATFSKLSSSPSLVMEARLSDFKGKFSQVRLFLSEQKTTSLINQKKDNINFRKI